MAIKKENGADILRPYIRAVTPEDRKTLPYFSHSKLECFENCPYTYYKKYVQGKRDDDDTSIALELGTLCHAVLEHKGYMITGRENDGVVDYNKLLAMLEDGIDEVTEKNTNHIPGLKELKKKYWETWSVPDPSDRTYDEKMELFKQVVKTEMEDTKWQPWLFEHDFEFVWNDRAIIHGFIDRLDRLEDKIKVLDYKTSRKAFDQKKLATSQQFGIYALGVLNEFGQLPELYQYRFICINEEQFALTNGWEKRLIKKLEKVFDQIDACKASGIYKPSPTPLCYWCSYSDNNPTAGQYRKECPYYSLWTREAPTWSVNKEFSEEDFNKPKETEKKRALVF